MHKVFAQFRQVSTRSDAIILHLLHDLPLNPLNFIVFVAFDLELYLLLLVLLQHSSLKITVIIIIIAAVSFAIISFSYLFLLLSVFDELASLAVLLIDGALLLLAELDALLGLAH